MLALCFFTSSHSIAQQNEQPLSMVCCPDRGQKQKAHATHGSTFKAYAQRLCVPSIGKTRLIVKLGIKKKKINLSRGMVRIGVNYILRGEIADN